MPSAARAVQCDAAEHHDCRRLLLEEKRIGGLWHAAGVLSDGLIAKQAASMLQRVFAPKVHGAWALQDASSGHPLDACVLFSSIAALYMSVAQANYAAANECLDALAEHRVARAQHAVSVQWGPWAGFGMASGKAISARMPAASTAAVSTAGQPHISVYQRMRC